MTAPASVHDPVCHMDIDPQSAAATSEHEGTTYHFCSTGCKHEFDEDPAGILAAEAAHDHGKPAAAGGPSVPSKRPWWRFWGR
jgi:Cu+-exporting ATPase